MGRRGAVVAAVIVIVVVVVVVVVVALLILLCDVSDWGCCNKDHISTAYDRSIKTSTRCPGGPSRDKMYRNTCATEVPGWPLQRQNVSKLCN